MLCALQLSQTESIAWQPAEAESGWVHLTIPATPGKVAQGPGGRGGMVCVCVCVGRTGRRWGRVDLSMKGNSACQILTVFPGLISLHGSSTHVRVDQLGWQGKESKYSLTPRRTQHTKTPLWDLVGIAALQRVR